MTCIIELIDSYCCDRLLGLIKVVGAIALLRCVIYFISSLLYHFTPGKNLKKAYGDWALVTGSTDGIGYGYAQRLAARHINVILVGRNEEKLANCSKELEDHYHVEVKTICADMYSNIDELREQFTAELKDIPISILINNVGVSYDHAMYLNELPDERCKQLIELNVAVTTMMTRVVLPGMIERKKGAIISVSSAAGITPIGDPLYAVYSGTKAYVNFFSKSLACEVEKYNITVECHVPYFVPSKLSKIRHASLFCPSAKAYAEASLNKVGKGSVTVVPYWTHALQNWVFETIPLPLLKFVCFKKSL